VNLFLSSRPFHLHHRPLPPVSCSTHENAAFRISQGGKYYPPNNRATVQPSGLTCPQDLYLLGAAVAQDQADRSSQGCPAPPNPEQQKPVGIAADLSSFVTFSELLFALLWLCPPERLHGCTVDRGVKPPASPLTATDRAPRLRQTATQPAPAATHTTALGLN
jgi:hypothetical protein